MGNPGGPASHPPRGHRSYNQRPAGCLGALIMMIAAAWWVVFGG